MNVKTFRLCFAITKRRITTKNKIMLTSKTGPFQNSTLFSSVTSVPSMQKMERQLSDFKVNLTQAKEHTESDI